MKKYISLGIDEDLLKDLDSLASKKRISRAGLISMLLSEGIEKYKDKKDILPNNLSDKVENLMLREE